VGQRQRRHREFLLATDAQSAATGRQDREAGAGGEEVGNGGRRGTDVLDAIEQEQQGPTREGCCQPLPHRSVAGLRHPDRAGRRREDPVRITERSEIHESGAIGVLAHHVLCHS
jgi:hypothetical protein